MPKLIKGKLVGDKVIFFLPLILSVFGGVMIFSASSASALVDFSNKMFFFNKQIISFLVGLAFFLLFSHLDYRLLRKVAAPFFLVNLFLLIIVLIPGIGKEVYGGRRWLDIGFTGFQPGELVKLSSIIYLATIFENKRSFFSFLTVLGLLLLLIILEPDMGTALIVTLGAVYLFFVAGSSIKEMLIIFFLGIVTMIPLIGFSAYRRQRVISYFRASSDAQTTSYHVKQILIALGSGGFLGRGLGQSKQKFLFLPEVATDSIFAVIAEEFGFLGALVLIFSFVFLIIRCFRVAVSQTDVFGRLLAGGIAFSLALQAIINYSSVVSLIPLTGVPLPFISYGGSSLLISLSGMGIVYNISRRK